MFTCVWRPDVITEPHCTWDCGSREALLPLLLFVVTYVELRCSRLQGSQNLSTACEVSLKATQVLSTNNGPDTPQEFEKTLGCQTPAYSLAMVL